MNSPFVLRCSVSLWRFRFLRRLRYLTARYRIRTPDAVTSMAVTLTVRASLRDMRMAQAPPRTSLASS